MISVGVGNADGLSVREQKMFTRYAMDESCDGKLLGDVDVFIRKYLYNNSFFIVQRGMHLGITKNI